MKFAILIPVFNRLEYTKKALEQLDHLPAQEFKAEFSVVVIDDGSSDGTEEWIRTRYPEVTLLKGTGNLWWSGSINLGARYAIEELNCDYLILWNNDIRFEPDYFQELVRLIAESGNDIILGSKVYVAEDEELVWSMGGYFRPRSGKYDMYGYFEKDREEYEQVREVDWLTGMGTIIPVTVVNQIGYWDERNFPQYHGDCDFTYRAKLAGFKNQVYPTLKIYNYVRNSGVGHGGNFNKLMQLLTDTRSKSNLKKNLKFYRLYARSPRAYLPLIWHYIQIFGGFFKWKLLRLLGIQRNEQLI